MKVLSKAVDPVSAQALADKTRDVVAHKNKDGTTTSFVPSEQEAHGMSSSFWAGMLAKHPDKFRGD